MEKIKTYLYNKLMKYIKPQELNVEINNAMFNVDILNKINSILSTSKTIYQKEYTLNLISEYRKSKDITEETIKILDAYITVLSFEIKYYYFTLEKLNE